MTTTTTPPTATTTATSPPSSVLASLRALTPRVRLEFADAKQLAERQAALLARRLGDLTEGALAELPRLRIVHETLATGGLSYWNGQEWIIALNAADSLPRQRFTLLHEFKHIIDHGVAHRLYRSQWETERAADYFAACALMPKPALKRAFCTITQDVAALAEHFGVSRRAVQIRLEQTRLVDPPVSQARCARPIPTPWHEAQRFVPIMMRRTA